MSVPAVFEIEGVIRRYDWGSTSSIQSLLGLEVDGRPAAELWFGAHPGDPSPALGSTLAGVIAADPVGLLGADSLARFGLRLPFLLKVLAAERALSIQVHPTRPQAQAGFAAEQTAGTTSGTMARNYVDDNHKPELLCALSPFEALCGFRPVAEILALLADLAIAELGFLADLLRRPDPLRAAFTGLLTLEDAAPVIAAIRSRAEPDGPLRAAFLAAEHFPDDIGVVLSLLLNHVRLEPGQAIYLGAGNVHAYLRGTGVEIMASSDNVLRCGLTAKRIDVAELLAVTDFSELRDPIWPAAPTGFQVPVPDFRLAERGAGRVAADGPAIVLCVDGTAEVVVAGTAVGLGSGHAAFVAAGAGSFDISGSGRVFFATVGQDDIVG